MIFADMAGFICCSFSIWLLFVPVTWVVAYAVGRGRGREAVRQWLRDRRRR
jgi:hypothetical protein